MKFSCKLTTAIGGLYDGAEEIVRWLREDYGVRLGLIRNSKASENAMRVRMRRAGIDDRQFDVVVMGGERSYAKPDPELFIEAAKQAGITDLHVRFIKSPFFARCVLYIDFVNRWKVRLGSLTLAMR
jgi:FMN phosphatase YigB (HAD superfamily)